MMEIKELRVMCLGLINEEIIPKIISVQYDKEYDLYIIFYKEEKVSNMKKKIGDLTIREAKEMQNKICNTIVGCKGCPFHACCINNYIDLEREIEVEE